MASPPLASVEAVLREAIACANAGDGLRRTALWSNERLRRGFAHNRWNGGRAVGDGEIEALPAAPVPLPEELRAGLLGIRAPRVLALGRVAALTGIESYGGYFLPGRKTYLTVFVRVDGRWQIAEQWLASPEDEGTPPAG